MKIFAWPRGASVFLLFIQRRWLINRPHQGQYLQWQGPKRDERKAWMNKGKHDEILNLPKKTGLTGCFEVK
jgi:hypothetical protein